MSNAPVLLADIGGTHTRFALLSSGDRPEETVSWDNDDYPSLADAMANYLAGIAVKPRSAVLAVAAPVTARAFKLTNRDWHIDLDALAAQFGFARIDAINDFEAQAWALTLLQDGDYRTVGTVTAAQNVRGVKIVLGPGTGLGVAALVPVGDGWQPVSTEGGHVSFGAASKDEEPVFARLHARGPVSAEMVVSGSGLPNLYDAMHPGGSRLTAEQIVTRAKDGDDAARATVAMFLRLLGRFAGDVALTFKAVGGVYIAGGVTGRLGALFDEANFRSAFEAHPPYGDLLRGIPTYLITARNPGLIGCGAFAMARQRSA